MRGPAFRRLRRERSESQEFWGEGSSGCPHFYCYHMQILACVEIMLLSRSISEAWEVEFVGLDLLALATPFKVFFSSPSVV